MRRSIAVYGCTLENGNTITTDDENVVEVRVHPDKSVSVKYSDETSTTSEHKWVSFLPRYN